MARISQHHVRSKNMHAGGIIPNLATDRVGGAAVPVAVIYLLDQGTSFAPRLHLSSTLGGLDYFAFVSGKRRSVRPYSDKESVGRINEFGRISNVFGIQSYMASYARDTPQPRNPPARPDSSLTRCMKGMKNMPRVICSLRQQ